MPNLQHRHLLLMIIAVPLLASVWVDAGFARTIRLERDGSGEYTVLQDALDAAAAGDTIRVGPGRYDDFRIETFRSGGVGATLGNIQVDSLTIIGESMDTSIIGPAVRTTAYQGEYAFGILADTELPVFLRLRSIAIVNTRRPLEVRGPVQAEGCRFGGGGESAIAISMGQPARCVFKSSVFEDDGDLSSRGIAVAVGRGPSSILIEGCEFRGAHNAINVSSTDSLRIADVRVTDGYVSCNRSQGVISTLTVSNSVAPAMIVSSSSVELNDSFLQGRFRSLVVSTDGIIAGARNHLATPLDATDPQHATLHINGANGCTLTDGDIMPSIKYSVFVQTELVRTAEYDLTDNYWGSVDSTQIAEWILDGHDSQNPDSPAYDVGVVSFMPVRGYSVGVKKQSVGGLKARY